MEIFKTNKTYGFMAKRIPLTAISAILIIISLFSAMILIFKVTIF